MPESTRGSEPKEALLRCLETLRVDVGARSVLLLDLCGCVLCEAGVCDQRELTVPSVLVANGMATALALADTLKGDQLSALHYYEADDSVFFAGLVNSDAVICLILDKGKQAVRVGSVWLYMKRSIETLCSMGADAGSLMDLVARDGPSGLAGQTLEAKDPAAGPGVEDDRPLMTLDQAQALGLVGAGLGAVVLDEGA
jgi:hypothetical protein